MSHIIWTKQSEIMCCLASTSANEANHARLITRGLHHKGSPSYHISTWILYLIFIGVPICVTSNHYEAMTSICSIIQNVGFGEMFRSLSKRSNRISTKACFQKFWLYIFISLTWYFLTSRFFQLHVNFWLGFLKTFPDYRWTWRKSSRVFPEAYTGSKEKATFENFRSKSISSHRLTTGRLDRIWVSKIKGFSKWCIAKYFVIWHH